MLRLILTLFALAFASAAPAQTVVTPAQSAVACAYNSALPSLASGTYGLVQCDTNGRLSVGIAAGTAIIGKVSIDQTTPGTTNGVQVNAALPAGTNAIGSVGGFNAIVTNTPTVQNAAYSASNAIGGWQQLSFFRNTTQPSGILDYVQVASKGGSTVALTVYGFTKSSANLSSTCTDKSAFSLNAADLSALIPGFPITLTPATTQGTTITSASQSVITSVKNADGTPSANLTFCVVVGGSVTPATTSDLVFNFGVIQD